LSEVTGNIRYGARQLMKSPGVTIATVLCLGVGIGANTAIFDIANGTLFPDTAIAEPDRVVRIYTSWPTGDRYSSFSWPDYLDVRDRSTTLASAATHSLRPLSIVVNDQPERTWGAVITGNYFATLGVEMALGRDLGPDADDPTTAQPAMLISHGYWQSRFGGDSAVIGTEVLLNSYPFTIVGVVDEEFVAPMVGMRCDLYVPLLLHEQTMPGMTWFEERGSHWLQEVSARLRSGVTVAQAEQELQTLFTTLQEEYPDSNRGKGVTVVPERESALHPIVRPQFQAVLLLLGVVVGLVLLLACANVAGLQLARAVGRRKEMGIRLALGANRGRLIRQILAESLLLALIAGVVGFFLAQITGPLTQANQPTMDIPLETVSAYIEALEKSGLIEITER